MKISLIIPCYNEEANLQKGVLDKIGNFTKSHKYFKEVLIVDDGSQDASRNIIKNEYLPRFSHFKLIENKHQGKALAVISGIQKAQEPYVMFSDIDLATPLEESEKLISELQNGYDIIIGSRSSTRKGAPVLRKVMAVGFIVVRNILLGLRGIRDTQCGFKLFKKDAAIKIIKNLQVFNANRKTSGSSVSAGFDLEFLFLAQKYGYKIKEIPVTWTHVETKNVHFIKDTIETLLDIAKIKSYDLKGAYEKTLS